MLQVDELLKNREKIQESFTSVPVAPKKVNSSGSGKGVVEDASVSADEGESPTMEESASDKAAKKKWFNLNFRAGVGSAGKWPISWVTIRALTNVWDVVSLVKPSWDLRCPFFFYHLSAEDDLDLPAQTTL